MSRSCTIWIERTPGCYDGIYCHSQGGLAEAGKILLENYSVKELVLQLLALGFISRLGAKLSPTAGSKHSFKTPEDGVTLAYSRDRGDLPCIFKGYDMKKAQKTANSYSSRYCYVFDPNLSVWKCGFGRLSPLLITCIKGVRA